MLRLNFCAKNPHPYHKDDPARSLVATSFEEWMREYHQKLSDGDLIFSDEYGGIVDKDED